MEHDHDESGLEMEDEARDQIGAVVAQAATQALDTGRFSPEQVQDIANAIRHSMIAGLEAWMTLFYEIERGVRGVESANGLLVHSRRAVSLTGMDLLKAALDVAIDSPPAQWAVNGLVRLLPAPHLVVTYQDVVVPGLPRGLEGLRILHVSDLHLAPGSELACELPDVAAGLPHDLAFYTGDFIDADAGIAPVAALLARMPRVEGAYAVLGNHDYRPYGRVSGANDVSALRHALSGAGLEILTNAARPVCGGELFVAGVNDPATDHDDLDRALGGVPDGRLLPPPGAHAGHRAAPGRASSRVSFWPATRTGDRSACPWWGRSSR